MGRAYSRAAKGITFMIAGGLLTSINDAIGKWLVDSYPVGEVVFFRSLFTLPLILAFCLYQMSFSILRITNLRLQVMRGVLMVIGNFLFVTGISVMPLADAVAITFAAPLFATALAIPILRERATVTRWAITVLGFVGVLVMMRPGSAEIVRYAALLPLGVALVSALRDTITRRIGMADLPVATLAFSTALTAIASLGTLPFGWSAPGWHSLLLFASGGLALSGAQYLVIAACRHAEMATVAPFLWSQIVWAVSLGYLLWGDVPDRWVVLGMVVLMASGILLIRDTARPGATTP